LSNTGRSEHLQSAFGAKSSQEAAEVYDSWAEDYERRVLSWGYATPAIVSWFFGRYVQPSDGAAILDAGAGTGIMGDVLSPLGYQDLTAIDISERMLDFARSKGHYKDLRQMELGSELDLPTDAFSAVVATGVFTAGHAPPESFDELIRATKSGGYIIFSVRTDVYEEGGFKDKQEALERESRWQLVEASEPFSPLRYEDPELKAQVFAYQVH
jgi:predicted TPR repeat methyltransferase